MGPDSPAPAPSPASSPPNLTPRPQPVAALVGQAHPSGADDARTPLGRYRPNRAPIPVKIIHFRGRVQLARRIEAKAQLEGHRMNELLLEILERGLATYAEPQTKPAPPG